MQWEFRMKNWGLYPFKSGAVWRIKHACANCYYGYSLVVPQTVMCVVALSSPMVLFAKQVTDILTSSL